MRQSKAGPIEQVGWETGGGAPGVLNILYDTRDKSFRLELWDYAGHGTAIQVTKGFLREVCRDVGDFIASRGSLGGVE